VYKKILFLIFFFSAALFLRASLAEDTGYSAVALDISGKVLVRSKADKKKEKPVVSGDLLYPGDIVKIQEDSTVTVLYVYSAREEKWPQKKSFTVGELKTERVPPEVEVKEQKLVLPEDDPEHQGAHIMKEVAPVEW
jgi:hypothetical protein